MSKHTQYCAGWTINGAVNRLVKKARARGVSEADIFAAFANAAGGVVNAADTSGQPTIADRSKEVVRPAAKPAKVKRQRTPEQIEADKARMARVRACRKPQPQAVMAEVQRNAAGITVQDATAAEIDEVLRTANSAALLHMMGF